jgi:alkanesulfonate monooxygenase SsuD/methylene tetrahydromethanopterin reductase-like flavin-dependent oxidoreductase (luciferase family)
MMRFAFMPVLSGRPSCWTDILTMWRAADDLDVFESGWVFDHFRATDLEASGPCYEAWTVMTALAQATARLRIGSMVLAVARRHPVLLAQMALTLDTISGGRVDLGVGAGWSPADHLPHGIELGPPGNRADRFDDYCGALVQLLRGQTVTRTSRHLTLINAACDIPPVQRPHPPLCIGGGGEKRTLRTAARWADHWNFPGQQLQKFASKRSVLHRYCAEAGRDPATIMTSLSLAADLAEPGRTAERAAACAAAGADLVVVQVPPPHQARALERLAAVLSPLC